MATTTIREQIMARLLALLYDTTDAQQNVYRARVTPFTRDDLPAINLVPKHEPVQALAIEVVERMLTIEMEIHVRDDAPDQAAEVIVQQAHALLMQDQTLGGLCARIIERETQWEFADADTPASKMTASYEIKYHTKAKDLTAT
jgi:hypothetical protein